MEYLFGHFQSPGLISFIEDICMTLIDKTLLFPLSVRITGGKYSKH